MDLAIILSSRFDLNASVDELFVAALDLGPFDVFLEHLDFLL